MREAGRIDQLKDGYFRPFAPLILILSFHFWRTYFPKRKFQTLIIIYIYNLIYLCSAYILYFFP